VARTVGPDRSPELASVAASEAADINRQYFVAYVTSLSSADTLRVLDFGCGGGALVRLLRAAGVDCWGADIFYAGAAYEGPLFTGMREAGILRPIGEDGVLPFEAESFDLVISDQVFEHIEDLDAVLDQLDRVLKPTGHMYHHFPSKEVLREGHIDIPLAHRFAPGRLRTSYTTVLRAIGLGNYKDGRSIADWTAWRLSWIDDYCFYRPYTELRAAFERRYVIEHLEIEYCRFRARGRAPLAQVLSIAALRGPSERIFRRLAFMAIRLTPVGRRSPRQGVRLPG
jgi:SAM-dependent methyltransferase